MEEDISVGRGVDITESWRALRRARVGVLFVGVVALTVAQFIGRGMNSSQLGVGGTAWIFKPLLYIHQLREPAPLLGRSGALGALVVGLLASVTIVILMRLSNYRITDELLAWLSVAIAGIGSNAIDIWTVHYPIDFLGFGFTSIGYRVFSAGDICIYLGSAAAAVQALRSLRAGAR